MARVLDVGTLDNGSPYMVMEFLAGTDFARVLKQRGALPIPEAIDFMLQAGEAIAEAHALGIVHRDLKPANLFLTTHAEGSPLVKVLDFGLSKMADSAADGSLTATGLIAGSPFYMSPEQIRSLKNVDSRTDIWALGTILYEMLAGRRAFDGPSLTAVCAGIIADAPLSLRGLRPEIPEALEAAVMRCLEKDVTRRMGNVAELAQAIAPFAPARSIASVEKIVRLLPGTVTAPITLVDADAAETLVMPAGAGSGPVVAQALAAQVTAKLESSGPAMPAATSKTGPSEAWGQTQAATKRKSVGWIVGVAGVVVVGVIGVAIWMSRAPDGNAAVGRPAVTATSATTTTTGEVPTPQPTTPTAKPEPTAAPSAEPSSMPATPPPPGPRAPTPAAAASTAKPYAAPMAKPPAADKPTTPKTDAKPAAKPPTPWD